MWWPRTPLSTSASAASATGAPASGCAVIDAILPPVDAGPGASVEEVALAREDHGQAELVGTGDDLLVTRRAGGPSGLDDHGDAGGRRRLDAVGEGIEGVAGAGAARRPAGRLRRRQLPRLDPVLLAGADPPRGAVLHQHDGVGRDPPAHPPRQLGVGPLGL